MKQLTIEQANRVIKKANNEGSPVTITFGEETRSYEAGSAKILQAGMEPGIYAIRTEKKTGEETETTECFVQIEPVEKPAPVVQAPPQPQAAPIPESALKDPTLLVIELRKQDQQGMNQERAFHQSQMESLRREHESDIARVRAEHATEIARLKADHDYQLKLVESNQGKLEKDRDELSKIIERRLRSETRFGKNQADLAWLDKLMENPVAMMMLAKMFKLDIGQMLPMLLGAAGNGGATGGFDLAKLNTPDFEAAMKLAAEALKQ